MGCRLDEGALHLIGQRAEGGLRDAESLLDQMISFQESSVTLEKVNSILGVMPKDAFFTLDRAGKEGNLAMAFEIAHQIFAEGKDIIHFVESLTEHFRTLLLIKLGGPNAPVLQLSPSDLPHYEASAKISGQEQCLNLLDYLFEAQNQIRFSLSNRITLEGILLHILRSHQRIPMEFLLRRLSELEQKMTKDPSLPKVEIQIPIQPPQNPTKTYSQAPLKYRPHPLPAIPSGVSPFSQRNPMPFQLIWGFGREKKAAPLPPEESKPASPSPASTIRAAHTPSAEEKRRYDTLFNLQPWSLKGLFKNPQIFINKESLWEQDFPRRKRSQDVATTAV